MSQIYIRSGMSPLVQPTTEEVIAQNLIGDNVGNLIFAYSIYRTLMVSNDVGYLPNSYAYRLEDVGYVNENCSYFILPLADMFRKDGERQMKEMTRFVERLTIPCIIAGVGLRAPIGTDLDSPFSFDPVVKDFLYAVKEKSALIGVRGETTGRYLQRFGFKEDKDYMVIGCPSMYAFGDYLPRKEGKLDKDARIAVNCSHICPQASYDFSERIMASYENSYFLPQRIHDLWLLYGGLPMADSNWRPRRYPLTLDHPYYQQDRVKMFLNAQSWIDFLKGMDFSVGSRFHGSVAAILAGTPSVILCHDNRMKELTEYHHIPHIMADELTEDLRLPDLVEKLDFDAMFKHHKENYYRYKKFLQANGIRSLFDEEDHLTDTLFDQEVARMKLPAEVPTARGISREELSLRWDRLYYCRNRFADFRMNRIRNDKEAEHVKRDGIIEGLYDEISWLTEQFNVLNNSTLAQETKRVALCLKDKFSHIDRFNYERARLVEDPGYIHIPEAEEEEPDYPLDELLEKMGLNFHPMEGYNEDAVPADPLKAARDETASLLAPDPEDSEECAKTKAGLLKKIEGIHLHENMSPLEISESWGLILDCRLDYHTYEYENYRKTQNRILLDKLKESRRIRRTKNEVRADWRMLNYSKVKWDVGKLVLKYLDAITRKDRDNLARAVKVVGHEPEIIELAPQFQDSRLEEEAKD